MTTLSTRGMIEIISHEGVCLDPYLDSVGVWTIGAGQTKSDGFDPKGHPPLTLQECFDLFKKKIKQYTDAVDKLGLPLSQTQYDALTSFCYNCGPGNLRTLCGKGRSLPQIGDALMLYTIPKEITERRRKEQVLFKTGIYSNTDGKVLVFPVRNNKPRYSEGFKVDARPYFNTTEILIGSGGGGGKSPASGSITIQRGGGGASYKPSITSPAKGSIGAWLLSLFRKA